MIGKTIRWSIVLFIIFFVAVDGTGAADVVRHGYNGVHDAATSLAAFVNSL